MPRSKAEKPEEIQRKLPPAGSAEARESQMVSYAMDLAEKQLRDGTATSQVQVHFLKLATIQSELELKKLEAEVRYREAQIKAQGDAAENDKRLERAMVAFAGYSGKPIELPDEDE